MKSLLYILLLFNISHVSYSQVIDSLSKTQEIDPVMIDRHFKLRYKQALNQIKRAYPMALETKRILDEYDAEMEAIKKKRKQKKYIKTQTKELKDEFAYAVKDLYIGEGKMLMKLIHRETGMTVDEILRKYKGKASAGLTGLALKAYGHDTQSTYDPKGDDWIVEIVIQDIESGKIKFDKSVKRIDKSGYKENMKEYRQGRREYRKESRKRKRKKPSR